MPRALLSVHDKKGLVEFAQGLTDRGYCLLASGGTARLLKERGIPVTEVADYTKSPEILGGRVKTLHPAIHGGLLARKTDTDKAELKALGWDTIDLVAVNLYPFEETLNKPGVSTEEIIENIDIGGVTLIRAAAKNHERVTLVCDPADYDVVLTEIRHGGVKDETRKRLAWKGFASTARYDNAISNYLAGESAEQMMLYPVQKLRYGENPHQKATLYSLTPGGGPLGGRVLQGKELSYTNLLDMDAAWTAVREFDKPTVCIVKHLSPCGMAAAGRVAEAFALALDCDRVSAFGGIVAVNAKVDGAMVEAMGDLFLECLVAPGFDDAARALLAKRKNLRLLEVPMPSPDEPCNVEWRCVRNGMLKQDADEGDPEATEWAVVSRRQPTEAEWNALRFAWIACRHVKSNAIVLARGEATVGIGGGQPNRVDCVRMAIARAGDKAKGAVMASDAFFPFPDSVQVAASAGISAVIHPGGSIRDQESVAAADAANVAMVVTGVRHFRH